MKNYSLTPAAIRRLCNGSMLLCLAVFGAGCETGPKVLTVTKTEKALPPPALLLETPSPKPTAWTGSGLLMYSQRLESALMSCNADKSSLREWAVPIVPGPAQK